MVLASGEMEFALSHLAGSCACEVVSDSVSVMSDMNFFMVICVSLIFVFAFPPVVCPKPASRVFAYVGFEHFHVEACHFVFAKRFWVVGDELEGAGIIASFNAFHFTVCNASIYFFCNSLGAGKHGSFLVKEVNPKVNAFAFGPLVGDKSDQSFLSCFLYGNYAP